MDKISIIIPVKNEEEKIERCLEAVFKQTVKPFEVIVVDGYSTDNTVEKAREFPIIIKKIAGFCDKGVYGWK